MGKEEKKVTLKTIGIIFCNLLLLLSFFISRFDSWDNVFTRFSLKEDYSGESFVSVLDAGEALSVLIQSNGEAALIDLGDIEDNGKNLSRNIKSFGIDTLKYVIVTHPHNDHIGGIKSVFENFKVQHFISQEYFSYENSPLSQEIINSYLEKEGISLEVPSIPTNLKVGRFSVNFVALFDEESDENDRSLIITVECDDVRFLITGDATKRVEKRLVFSGLDIKSDILILGHHGSKESSSEEFLDYVSPEVAICSSGISNPYNHPSDEVLNRLKKRDITLKRTDTLGNVTVVVGDGKYEFR